MEAIRPISVERQRLTRWDALAVLLVIGLLVFLAQASRKTSMQPLSQLDASPVSLDPANCPNTRCAPRCACWWRWSRRSCSRFGLRHAGGEEPARVSCSCRCSTSCSRCRCSATSRSLYVLSRVSPGRVLGAEFAAIFAIFTSQAWNMAFGFYQSLRTVPRSSRSRRVCFVSRLGCVSGAGSSLRHAAAHLEHDDVDVGRLVFCRRFRGDQRRQYHGHGCRAWVPTLRSRWRKGASLRWFGPSPPC